MNWTAERKKVANWMKEYAESSEKKGYVVGLSGGVDSSLTACAAVDAVGNENVIGVSLPCQTSPDMRHDAQDLAKNLEIVFIHIPILAEYHAIVRKIGAAGEAVTNITQANIKARLRMVMLYGIANQHNYLVAGTGNLSELQVGYCTKYGDHAVDLESFGNYYKTEIYEMAKITPQIPKRVITKAPSADLWEGQTDEEELGMPYSEIDEILKGMDPKNNQSLDGIDKDKIEKIKNMIKKAEHKNNLPPRYERK